MNPLRKIIRDYRKRKGITQEQLAEYLKMSVRMIKYYESESYKITAQMADYLRMKLK